MLLLLSFSFYETREARKYYSETEQECRFREVNEVLDFIKNNHPKEPIMLICDNILLYQNLCTDDFCVCDSRHINMLAKNSKYKYFFVASDLNYLRKRYGIDIDMSRLERQHTLSNGNIIHRIIQ